MQTPYDIVIIGGGTAGITAAIYGYRSGKKILIIEKNIYGGQIITTSEIENYPAFRLKSGYEFAAHLQTQLQQLHISHASDEVIGIERFSEQNAKRTPDHQIPSEFPIWNVRGTLENYSARTVIIATGATHRPLGLPDEDRFVGHGLSYCATCDGRFYKGRKTAVIGGGNTAMEESLYLSELCSKVYLVYRSEQLHGDALLQSRIKNTGNIHLLPSTRVIGLHGNSKLDKIEISPASDQHDTSSIHSDSHTADSHALQIDGLFVAIGQIPQNNAVANIVRLDHEGYIITDENCNTGAPGIYAAGDCRAKKLRQLITAAADGAAAATEAINFLRI